MKRLSIITSLLSICLLAGSAVAEETAPVNQEGRVFKDMATEKVVDPELEYRLGSSGICGTVKEDHILVTHVIPGSPADGKVQPGDLLRGLQHRGLGSNIQRTVSVRIYRLGRDWDWKLFVTVERSGLRGGKGNTIELLLQLPPAPGALHHFGPTGIYGKMYSDHIVVDRLEKGSPADGKLLVGDHIVEVGGKRLAGNIHKLFAKCINEAEAS